MFPGFSAPGDGEWVPLVDKRHPEDPPRLLKTLIHPDKSRGWAELFVVAVDLRRVRVEMMAGYQEPRTEKKEAEGYQRPSKIPESDWDLLLGAFNGGFMAEHGRVFQVLGLMQWFWYGSDKRRERFVKICEDKDVQQLTFESYMNKVLSRRRPLAQLRIFLKDAAHLLGIARV